MLSAGFLFPLHIVELQLEIREKVTPENLAQRASMTK